jgi:hypothetical protein
MYIYMGLKSSQEEFPSSQVPKAIHGWCQHFRGQGKSKIDLVLSETKVPPNRIVIIFSLNNFHLGVYTSSSAKPRYYISNQNTNEHSTNIEDRPHVSRCLSTCIDVGLVLHQDLGGRHFAVVTAGYKRNLVFMFFLRQENMRLSADIDMSSQTTYYNLIFTPLHLGCTWCIPLKKMDTNHRLIIVE